LPDKVRVLATATEKAEKIEVQRAETALRKSQEALSREPCAESGSHHS